MVGSQSSQWDMNHTGVSNMTDMAYTDTEESKISELALIGGLLSHPSAIDMVGSELKVEDVSHPMNRILFKAISRMRSEGVDIDAITVASFISRSNLGDGNIILPYIGELMIGACALTNITYHASVVKENSMMRSLWKKSNLIPSIISDRSKSTSEKVADIELSISGTIDSYANGESTLSSVTALLPKHVERMELRTSGEELLLTTGFDNLDEILCGGLRPLSGELVVIGGRPSMGKTTLGLNVARHISVDKKIPFGIFSLEMGSLQLMDKLVSDIGSINNATLRRGAMDEDEYSRYAMAMSKMSECPLYVEEKSGLTISDIEKKTRHMKRKYDIMGIVVDYIQLIRGDNQKISRAEQIEDISRRLKLLGKALGIVVIALAQLNRGADGESRPSIAHLRNSGAIEQDADIILFPYREERDDRETDKKGEAELIVGKQREGDCGVLPLLFDGAYSRFRTNNFGRG